MAAPGPSAGSARPRAQVVSTTAPCTAGYGRTLRLAPAGPARPAVSAVPRMESPVMAAPPVQRRRLPVTAAPDASRVPPQSARLTRTNLTQSRVVMPVQGTRPRPGSSPSPRRVLRSAPTAATAGQPRRALQHAHSARGVDTTAQGPAPVAPLSTGLRHWVSMSSIPQQESTASLLQAARSRASLVTQPIAQEGTSPIPPAAPARLVSANALRALEPMLQDVADFGSEDGSCSICLGADASEVTELRCGNRHRFHKSCITTWMVASLAINNGAPRCPLCRKHLEVDRPAQGGSRRDVLDLSLQELTAVERLLEDVRFAVLEQRSVISSHVESQVESGSSSPSTTQLRAAQLRALMLEDRVAELRSAVYELQSRLSLL